MADPTVNRPWEHKGDTCIVSRPMDKASMTLYRNQLICNDTTGYAVAGANTAVYQFAGVATEKIDDQASGDAAADGTYEIKCQTKGMWKGAVTGAAVTEVGSPVFLSDSGLCVLTPTEVFVGYLEAYVSSGIAWIRLGDPPPTRFIVAFPIAAAAASSTKTSLNVWTAPRNCKIMAAWACATQYPNYDTSVIDVDKYNLDDTSDKAVVNAFDIDNKTNKQITALTLTGTAADLLLTAGDTLRADQTLAANQVATSIGLTAIVELQWYGPANQ